MSDPVSLADDLEELLTSLDGDANLGGNVERGLAIGAETRSPWADVPAFDDSGTDKLDIISPDTVN